MDPQGASPPTAPPPHSAALLSAAPIHDVSASSRAAETAVSISYQMRYSEESSPQRTSASGASSSSSSTGSESDQVEIDCGSSVESDDAVFKKPLVARSMELRFRHVSYTVSTRSKRGSDAGASAPGCGSNAANTPSVSQKGTGGSGESCRSSLSQASSKLSSVSRQLTMKKNYTRTILADINGAARSGEVTAIMGASGSGKTTLLNILAHRIATDRRSGSVELDGAVVRGSTMRRMSAYVMQDDLMFPALTVRETLMFAAELRLSARGVTREEKERKVESLLELLGLTKVADSLIGNESQRGVSGGERKRVAIGVEMVSDPRILFLDEPTSGLDSTSAYRVVRAIKDIAVQTGSIAIMVLHQPSFRVLSLIDRLLLLASGHTIFHGPPPQLPTFLASFGCPVPRFANSTEFALDLIEDYQRSARGVADLVAYAASYQQLSHMSQDAVQSSLTKASVAKPVAALPVPHPVSNDATSCCADDAATCGADGAVALQIDDCAAAEPAVDAAVVAAASAAAITVQKSVSGETCVSEDKGVVADTRRYANGWMGELMVLTRRAALNLWRTPALYLLRLALVAVTGLMLATLYFNPDSSLQGFQERLAFFSFSICVLFFCCLDAVPIFIEERNIFIRETTRNAYRPSTYLVATTLVYLPLQLAMALIFVLENWWAINLTGGAAGFFFMLLTCFLILFSASSFAIAISVVVDHVVLAYAAGIALMAYFALVSGFYIPKYSIPNYWIWLHYLSPMKYAYEALIQSEFTRGGPCYMQAGNMFLNTPLQPYVNETTMNKAFLGMRTLLAGTPYKNISATTCLQDGQQLMVTLVGQPDLNMWLNLLVLLGFGLLIRFITFLLLVRLRSLKQQ
ncbi:hypothetical protein CLOM_g5840 [Closterium sp. NIES-68]|nr:hypothetical protein CLOM_g5840 [Closterium sp. NIES-68]GJP73900.1 hypothetical protein CLOP_g4570 [Closterium sp. NIES-67]